MITSLVAKSSTTDTDTQRKPLACDIQQKRLAEMGPDGLYLWCKACHREHLVTWAEIDLVRKHLFGA